MVVLGSGNYVKTADVDTGDFVIFKDEGEWIESTRWKYEDGSPKVDFVIGVEVKGEDKKMRLNKTNRDAMIEAYGADTAGWVGKTAIINKEKVMVAGKKMDCIVLDVPDPGDEKPGEEEIPF